MAKNACSKLNNFDEIIKKNKNEKDKDNEAEMLEMNGKPEYKRLLTEDLEAKFKDVPLTRDTTCGYGFLRSEFLQK